MTVSNDLLQSLSLRDGSDLQKLLENSKSRGWPDTDSLIKASFRIDDINTLESVRMNLNKVFNHLLTFDCVPLKSAKSRYEFIVNIVPLVKPLNCFIPYTGQNIAFSTFLSVAVACDSELLNMQPDKLLSWLQFLYGTLGYTPRLQYISDNLINRLPQSDISNNHFLQQLVGWEDVEVLEHIVFRVILPALINILVILADCFVDSQILEIVTRVVALLGLLKSYSDLSTGYLNHGFVTESRKIAILLDYHMRLTINVGVIWASNQASFRVCVVYLIYECLANVRRREDGQFSHSIEASIRFLHHSLSQPVNFSVTAAEANFESFRETLGKFRIQMHVCRDIADLVKPFPSTAALLALAGCSAYPMSLEISEARLAVARVLIEMSELVSLFGEIDRVLWQTLLDLSIIDIVSFALRRRWPTLAQTSAVWVIEHPELESALAWLNLPHGSSQFFEHLSGCIANVSCGCDYQDRVHVNSCDARFFQRAVYLANHGGCEEYERQYALLDALFPAGKNYAQSIPLNLYARRRKCVVAKSSNLDAVTFESNLRLFTDCFIKAMFEHAFVFIRDVDPIGIYSCLKAMRRAIAKSNVYSGINCNIRRKTRLAEALLAEIKALYSIGVTAVKDARVAEDMIVSILTPTTSPDPKLEKQFMLSLIPQGLKLLADAKDEDLFGLIKDTIAQVPVNRWGCRGYGRSTFDDPISLNRYLPGKEWTQCDNANEDCIAENQYRMESRIDVHPSLSFRFESQDDGTTKVMMSIDGGKSWTERSRLSFNNVRAVAVSSGGTVKYFVSSFRDLYVSTDNLETLQLVTGHAPFINEDDIFIVTPAGNLLICWLETVWGNPYGGNRFFRSVDGGVTWEKYGSRVFVGSVQRDGFHTPTNLIACLGKKMYLVLQDGRIAESASDGKCWRIKRSSVSINRILYDPRGERLVGFDQGDVYAKYEGCDWYKINHWGHYENFQTMSESCSDRSLFKYTSHRFACINGSALVHFAKMVYKDGSFKTFFFQSRTNQKLIDSHRVFVIFCLGSVGFDARMVNRHVLPFLFPDW